jgi:uncharacterized protein YecE (DUF72 family)
VEQRLTEKTPRRPAGKPTEQPTEKATGQPAGRSTLETPESATAAQTVDPKIERRRKREERREKQRAANLGRAEKMRKLRHKRESENLSPVYTTPAVAEQGAPACHIGCSGWFYWRWRGGFYPQEMPTGEWFGHYAAHFQTVEINASFYSWPTEAAVRTWLKQAPQEDFVYTVKVNELITHIRKFDDTETLVKDFGVIADILESRMGCFLFQLPPSFHYSEDNLQRILGQLDHSRRNVVEFRHASWWNETVYAAFRRTGTIFCSCSGPRLPEALVKTADDIYVRFHGVTQWYRHDYSDEELGAWAGRIRESGAKRAWVYFNNDYDGFATKNARSLAALLASLTSGQDPASRITGDIA